MASQRLSQAGVCSLVGNWARVSCRASEAVNRNREPGKLIEEWSKAGVLLSTEGCLPSSKGAKVKRSGKDLSVTDGPFTEAKEVVGGFAIIKAESKAEAIEWAKKFLNVAGDGETKILQLYEEAAL